MNSHVATLSIDDLGDRWLLSCHECFKQWTFDKDHETAASRFDAMEAVLHALGHADAKALDQ